MARVRFPALIAACALVLAAAYVLPPTHELLRRLAYDSGILHSTPPLRTGSAFPALTVAEMNGSHGILRASTGTVVYNVFATWCPPCRMEAPVYAAISPVLRRHGVSIVGIDQGETPAAVARFETDFGISYPIVIDTDSATRAILSARVIPETIVVRNGVVRDIALGPVTRDYLLHVAEGV